MMNRIRWNYHPARTIHGPPGPVPCSPFSLHPHGYGPLIRLQSHARPQAPGANGLTLEAGRGQDVANQRGWVAHRVRPCLARGRVARAGSGVAM